MFNKNNDYDKNANKYSQLDLIGTGTVYLSFRDIPSLIAKLGFLKQDWNKLQVLDYGCGAGRSSRYLKYIGISEVMGVDVNCEMIKEAISLDPYGNYQVIQSAEVLAPAQSFDLIFSSFVLVEISSPEEIFKIFKEAQRLLKPDGYFIVVTVSRDFFNKSYTWLSYDQNFPGSEKLKSGQAIKFKIKEIDLELQDYYWDVQDIMKMVQEAGYQSFEVHKPLGTKNDSIEWASETLVSPYDIFLIQN